MSHSNIYLDHAASTPIRPKVLLAMKPYFSQDYGNPSSIHALGEKARLAVEEAREKVRELLNASADDKIIFTSGGTESVNLAIQGIVKASGKKTIITSSIEHEAVLACCAALEKIGKDIEWIPVDRDGIAMYKELHGVLHNNVALVSIIYANNEVGTIQPLSEISRITRKMNIPVHTDACQAGFLELDVQKLGIDLMTLNGSKIYGPKGVGILYVREGIPLQPLFYGGGQEYGLRSGTENVPAIVGFSKALELAQREKERENSRLRKLQQMLIKGLLQIPGSYLNGHPIRRLANNINISFSGIEGEQLVRHLSAQGIFCSSGSACSSQQIEASHVLLAMNVKYPLGAIRFTLGKSSTEKEMRQTIPAVQETVKDLKRSAFL